MRVEFCIQSSLTSNCNSLFKCPKPFTNLRNSKNSCINNCSGRPINTHCNVCVHVISPTATLKDKVTVQPAFFRINLSILCDTRPLSPQSSIYSKWKTKLTRLYLSWHNTMGAIIFFLSLNSFISSSIWCAVNQIKKLFILKNNIKRSFCFQTILQPITQFVNQVLLGILSPFLPSS